MSLKAEVPGIRLAIDHLQELGERMQNEDYGFKENDVENIDSIIEALGELEAERDKLHELLEIETIQASVLRHKLQVYPGKIKGEIEAAVKSARQSNADEVQRLQSQLEKVTKNIEFLELKLQELEEENAKLLPERDGMRKKHEEIIATLNVRLAEKATNQISLNETRDQLRATNQNIVNLEENILILKEDMIQERADARMEKKRLKKAVYDTTMKVREQRDANIVKKKELDALLEKLAESEGQLDMIRKSIRRYDTSRAKLEGQERALMAQLNREIKQNQELKQKRIEIEEESNRQQKEFEESKAALEGKLEELEVEIQKQSKKFERLDGQKMILEMDVEDAMEQRRKDAQNVEEINGILQAAKITLAKKAEETGRLTNENVYMEEAIVKLKETHELVVATLNKQIEEYRDQLSKERAERMELQAERDDVQKNVDDFRQENQRFMALMNKKINDTKNQIESLNKEGIQLQKDIREGDQTIKRRHEELRVAKQNYVSMKASLEKELTDLEASVEHLGKRKTEREKYLEEKMPVLSSLEEEHDAKQKEYEARKKEIVVLKNKKTGLEETCKRTQKNIEKLEEPTVKNQQELKLKKEESLVQLKQHAEEMKVVESDIYTEGCKLKTVMEENHKFREAIEKYETDIVDLNEHKGKNEQMKQTLLDELIALKGILLKGWEADHALEKVYAEKDQTTVGEITDLLHRTEKREQKISSITEQLEGELLALHNFLENVAKRRPKPSGNQRSKSRTSVRSQSRHTMASAKASGQDRSASRAEKSERASPSRSVSPQKSLLKGEVDTRSGSPFNSKSQTSQRGDSPQRSPSRASHRKVVTLEEVMEGEGTIADGIDLL